MTKKVVISFPDGEASRPLIYELIKKYDIMVSIIKADIAGGRSGKLVLELDHGEITWAPRENHVGPTGKSRGPPREITWVLVCLLSCLWVLHSCLTVLSLVMPHLLLSKPHLMDGCVHKALMVAKLDQVLEIHTVCDSLKVFLDIC